jgi:hypothetical protein
MLMTNAGYRIPVQLYLAIKGVAFPLIPKQAAIGKPQIHGFLRVVKRLIAATEGGQADGILTVGVHERIALALGRVLQQCFE